MKPGLIDGNSIVNNRLLKNTLTVAVASAVLFSSSVIKAEDFLDVYRITLGYNPVLKQSISNKQSVTEGKEQAFANFLPQINAAANTQANRRTNVLDVNGGKYTDNYNSHGYNVNLVQSIYDNTNYVSYRISDINISVADAELAATEQNLIITTAQAYFGVLRAIDAVGFSKAELKAIGRQLEQATRRYEVGIIAITDVHEAQAGYDSARALVIKAENDLEVAKENLREVAGQKFDIIDPLNEKIPMDPPQPNDIQQWVDLALANNMSLKAAQYNTESAKENIDLQRSGHYPTLDLVATHNYNNSNGPGSSNAFASDDWEDSAVGIQFSLPIYQGGAVNSKTRQARYNFQNAQEKRDEVRDFVEKNTRSSYLNVISDISQIEALKQAIISNESAVAATEAGFEVGTRTIVDVLNVQRDLYRAKQLHADARYIFVINILKLKQAAGSLSIADVETVNSWIK